MKFIVALVALFGTASAFAPAKLPMQSRTVARAAPSMSFKSDMAKVAAVATSGTNEILGIDTFIIPILAFPTLLVANFAFNDWAQAQDNDDFFDELPPTPK